MPQYKLRNCMYTETKFEFVYNILIRKEVNY